MLLYRKWFFLGIIQYSQKYFYVGKLWLNVIKTFLKNMSMFLTYSNEDAVSAYHYNLHFSLIYFYYQLQCLKEYAQFLSIEITIKLQA